MTDTDLHTTLTIDLISGAWWLFDTDMAVDS